MTSLRDQIRSKMGSSSFLVQVFFQKICTKEELLPLFGRTYFDFETLRRKGGRRPPFTKVSLLDREIFGQHHSGRNWMLRDFRMPNRS